MDRFLGKWRMESSENFDAIMERLNVSYFQRKAGNSMRPNFVLRDLGNGRYLMRSESAIKSTESQFRLGEEFAEKTPDGREVNSIVFLEPEGVLRHIQNDDRLRKTTQIDRMLENGGRTMRAIVRVDEIVCTRIYRKVE